jgi:hypothetical protein
VVPGHTVNCKTVKAWEELVEKQLRGGIIPGQKLLSSLFFVIMSQHIFRFFAG